MGVVGGGIYIVHQNTASVGDTAAPKNETQDIHMYKAAHTKDGHILRFST